MKKITLLIILILLTFTYTFLLPYIKPKSNTIVLPPRFSSLSYTESSTGLQSILLEGGRTEVEMADINNDGHIDFLSIGDHGSPFINSPQHGIMVWFGNGSGSNWSLFMNGNFGYGGIAIGDVNNDGRLDAGYGMHHNYSSNDFGDQLLEVALGDGTGMNWIPWDDSLASQGETWGMFSTDFGDIDNDGRLDVGSVSFGCCAGVSVYRNLGNGIWRRAYRFSGGNSAMDFVFGDMNNDGNLDFAVAHQYGTPYFGDGNGGFTLRQNNLPAPGNSGYRGVSLGDVNNDGAKDLAFITGSGSSSQINVWKWNNATGNWDNQSSNLPTGNYSATVLADMNMDGFVDLVVYRPMWITIWAGNGGTSWTQIAEFQTHPSPGTYSDFTINDADRNGYPDILIQAAEGAWPNQRNKLRFFKETTPFNNISITPVYPRGYERFKNNSVKFIDWVSAVPPLTTSKVKLEFSPTGSNGPWSLIADSLPNNGRYQWQVISGVNSANCFIRYTVYIPGSGTSATSVTPNPFIVGDLVGIKFIYDETPAYFKLEQNYPNPFNSLTNIKFSIPKAGHVKLQIFDVIGRKEQTLVNEQLQTGTYEVSWDASNYPSGVYYYILESDNFINTKKMVLIK